MTRERAVLPLLGPEGGKNIDFTPRVGDVQTLAEVRLPTDPQPITDVLMFFTSACNSRCVTCDIWKDKAHQEFPFEKFVEMANEPLLTGATWALIGGEFTAYSKYIDVVDYLNLLKANYYLITNALLPERIKRIYDRTALNNLSISLDAMWEKHDAIRGVPGNFDKVRELLAWVKVNHPETRVRIGFTMSEYNTRQDLIDVTAFCHMWDVELKLAVACDAAMYTSHTEGMHVGRSELYEFEDLVPPGDNYLQLYRPWVKGWEPRCEGILQHVTVNYNGDVVICPTRPMLLGNVLDRRFPEVWLDEETAFRREAVSKTCNQCWMSCIRKYDAKKVSSDNVRHLRGVFNCDEQEN
jgi:MoaA/NifB/PqqE/SkfB family radical SAM enzyme